MICNKKNGKKEKREDGKTKKYFDSKINSEIQEQKNHKNTNN